MRKPLYHLNLPEYVSPDQMEDLGEVFAKKTGRPVIVTSGPVTLDQLSSPNSIGVVGLLATAITAFLVGSMFRNSKQKPVTSKIQAMSAEDFVVFAKTNPESMANAMLYGFQGVGAIRSELQAGLSEIH